MTADLKLIEKPYAISDGLAIVDREVNRSYLADLETHNVIALKEEEEVLLASFGFVKITRIVSDKKENFNEKLASVYSSLYTFFTSTEQDVDGAIIMLICGEPDDEPGKVDYYLGIRHKQKKLALSILSNSLEGNFPGSDIKPLENKEIEPFLNQYIPKKDAQKKIASVYAVPSLRTEKDENFVQGIENFIDSMAGKKYTALFVSTPISKREMEQRKRGFENIYTELSKFSELNISLGENESRSDADGKSFSFTETFGKSVSDATGHSYSESSGSTEGGQGFFGSTWGKSQGITSGTNSTHTSAQNKSKSESNTTSETITNTVGRTRTASSTIQVKTIQEHMKKIELQLERIDGGMAYGLWESACYFISDKPEISLIAANTYRSLLVGEKTSTDRSVINFWGNNLLETEKLMDYLHNSKHPVFIENTDVWGNHIYPIVSASNMINGKELPLLMGLPQKSVSGVTSISFASFGRNVQNSVEKKESKDNRKINIGCIYHMGKELSKTKVELTANEFTKHCFVTGSTGSGKSNTVYKLLEEFINQKETDISKDGVPHKEVNFLIIEPAKGEYKLALGKLQGINIFTTNAKYYKLLKLNPFSFCDDDKNGIHVLEHLDRLIEIFSACWPLYAAMPAVLKESFEKAYERVGWDLQNSIYIGEGKKKYPSFKIVCEILPEVINTSEYSAENKGNYTGALVTRVKSLTMGIMGTVFSEDFEIENEVLFDQNTIIDISRVGSTETKSLIMGILILKLNEYRMSEGKGTNLPLRHITVLEEAHNILKRTSTDQNQEGANLAGKSVEMISNSIAEMRTYGEGFIIVDQSPAMVAQSAITNTNTKIIMRLADFGDCEAVGHSVSLNDEQIKEISRLNQGVAVVHQSSWTEAVLVKIDKADKADNPKEYGQDKVILNDLTPLKELRGLLLIAIFEQRKNEFFNLKKLYSIIEDMSDIRKETKDTYKKYIENIEEFYKNENQFSEMIVNILDCKGMIGACMQKITPLRVSEVMENGKLVKKEELIDKSVSDTKDWIFQLERALSNYVNRERIEKDNFEKIIFNIVQWIDWQRMKENKTFNSNILLASRIARWSVLKDKYPIRY